MTDHSHEVAPGRHVQNDTTRTFLIGIGAALAAALGAYLVVAGYLSIAYPAEEYNLMDFISTVAGLSAAATAGLVTFFPGRFEIAVGEVAYLMFIGRPIFGLKLGPGYGWYVPLFMGVNIQPGRGLTVEPGEQSNMTENGIETTSNVAGTYRTVDLERVQASIDTARIEEFVSNALVAAVRDFIASLNVDVEDALNKDELTTEQAFHIIREIAKFKHSVEQNGNKILKSTNETLHPAGLDLSTIQIKDVGLPEEIEQAAKRVITETIESGGLLKDAKNKKANAKELLRLYEEMGIKLDTLDPATAADHVSRALDSALASEDKAKVFRHNFGGQPPRGSILNTGE